MHPTLLRLILPAALLAVPVVLRAQSPADSARMERAINGLRPGVDVEGRPAERWPLAERMAHHHVPGASIAVVDGGRIVWARGFGVRQAGGADPVTATTLFQAASVSKVIAATATLRLVEQGRLDLDADVNRYLTSWRVPENAFTAREKVTLRRILSHSAGLTVHGFRGYRPGATLPTIVQVLDGQAPANSAPVRVDTVPGAITRYSGGGTTVQQLVLTEVGEKPFPRLAEELVLLPAGMRNSTFAQPLAREDGGRAARGHGGDGSVIPGAWSVYTEMAAGGLWTTAGDLMRWAIAIDEARGGKPGALLSPAIAAQMLTPQSEGYGLGPELEGEGRAFRFAHGGSNPGYRAQVTYFPETCQGVAILVNGDGGDPLIDEIQRALAAEYGWPALAPPRVVPVALDAAAVHALAGEYALELGGGPPARARLAHEGGRWLLTAPMFEGADELVAVSATGLVSIGWGYTLRFDVDAAGRATGFTLTYNRTEIPGTRIP
jgi:CubicO group peptidase (beta-lactamase class C family)